MKSCYLYNAAKWLDQILPWTNITNTKALTFVSSPNLIASTTHQTMRTLARHDYSNLLWSQREREIKIKYKNPINWIENTGISAATWIYLSWWHWEKLAIAIEISACCCCCATFFPFFPLFFFLFFGYYLACWFFALLRARGCVREAKMREAKSSVGGGAPEPDNPTSPSESINWPDSCLACFPFTGGKKISL